MESCVICGSSQSHLNNVNLLGLGMRRTLECTGCGMISRYPFFTPESLNKYYSNHFFRYSNVVQNEMARNQALDLYKALNGIDLDLTKLKVLEIGSGNGYFLKNLIDLGIECVEGIEPDEQSVKFASETLKVNVNKGFVSMDNFNKLPHSCDVIVMLHVIEHMHDPVAFIEKLIAKYPEAYFYIEVPDVKFEKSHIELSTFSYSLTAQHLFSFSRESLQILFYKNGISNIWDTLTGNAKYYRAHLRVLKLKLWTTQRLLGFEDIANITLFEIMLLLIKLSIIYTFKYIQIKCLSLFDKRSSARMYLPSVRLLFKRL
jgi:SAM-dependent methyltransferase